MKFDKHHLLLYAVTDRTWLEGRTPPKVTEEILKNGATFLQLREKELDSAALLAEGLEGRELLLVYPDGGGDTLTAGWAARDSAAGRG